MLPLRTKSVQSMRTPPRIFDLASSWWGPFDCDVASSADNALCERYLTAPSVVRSKPKLEQIKQWGTNNWCNPPWSDTKHWVEAAKEAAKRGKGTTMLLRAELSVGWSRRLLRVARAIVMLTPRVDYIDEAGEVHKAPCGSMLALITPESLWRTAPLASIDVHNWLTP